MFRKQNKLKATEFSKEEVITFDCKLDSEEGYYCDEIYSSVDDNKKKINEFLKKNNKINLKRPFQSKQYIKVPSKNLALIQDKRETLLNWQKYNKLVSCKKSLKLSHKFEDAPKESYSENWNIKRLTDNRNDILKNELPEFRRFSIIKKSINKEQGKQETHLNVMSLSQDDLSLIIEEPKIALAVEDLDKPFINTDSENEQRQSTLIKKSLSILTHTKPSETSTIPISTSLKRDKKLKNFETFRNDMTRNSSRLHKAGLVEMLFNKWFNCTNLNMFNNSKAVISIIYKRYCVCESQCQDIDIGWTIRNSNNNDTEISKLNFIFTKHMLSPIVKVRNCNDKPNELIEEIIRDPLDFQINYCNFLDVTFLTTFYCFYSMVNVCNSNLLTNTSLRHIYVTSDVLGRLRDPVAQKIILNNPILLPEIEYYYSLNEMLKVHQTKEINAIFLKVEMCDLLMAKKSVIKTYYKKEPRGTDPFEKLVVFIEDF